MIHYFLMDEVRFEWMTCARSPPCGKGLRLSSRQLMLNPVSLLMDFWGQEINWTVW